MGITKQIWFTDILNGYTVNENGAVFRTIDGGNSFTTAGQTCLQTPFDMQFINDSTGFVVGSFVNASCDISYTTNYGNTWQPVILPYEYAAWGAYAFDTTNIYIAGQNQSIIHVGNNGVVTSTKPNNEYSIEDIRIYPNPTSSIIFVDFAMIKDKAIVEITNIQGQILLSETISTPHAPIDVAFLSSGIYFIKIDKLISKKLIKW